MAHKRYLATKPDPYNRDMLLEEVHVSWPEALDVNEVLVDSILNVAVYVPLDSEMTEDDWLVIVDNHDGTALTKNQAVENLIKSSNDLVRGLFSGILDLNPDESAYAALGRAIANYKGADQATIDAIVSRATAAQYLNNTDNGVTEWTNASPEMRQLMVLFSEGYLRLFLRIAKELFSE